MCGPDLFLAKNVILSISRADKFSQKPNFNRFEEKFLFMLDVSENMVNICKHDTIHRFPLFVVGWAVFVVHLYRRPPPATQIYGTNCMPQNLGQPLPGGVEDGEIDEDY